MDGQIDRFIILNCPVVPDGTRPSRSRPSSPAWPCNTARSRSRRCRPLSVQCGTAGSGHSGLCSLEMLRGTREPCKERQKKRKRKKEKKKSKEKEQRKKNWAYSWALILFVMLLVINTIATFSCLSQLYIYIYTAC